MKVLMVPGLNSFNKEESGIKRVVEVYTKLLPQFDIEVVEDKNQPYDIIASHAGTVLDPDVLHCHGLYWSSDYKPAKWELEVNKDVITAARHAKLITVPSRWVQESFQRDMRVSPIIVPHGIDTEEWKHTYQSDGYVLWNKNRYADVCDPTPVKELALRFKDTRFMTTFAPLHSPDNVSQIGIQPHEMMKKLIQRAGVYLSTTKETFGIGSLEAMASGVPVLGFAHGGNLETVQHGVNGYLARPYDYDDLADGLLYCIKNRSVLGRNGIELAGNFSWQRSVEIIAGVYREATKDEPPTVAIIIPTYNYADKVERAIRSAMVQDYPMLSQIIVVDDGSGDGGQTERVVHSLSREDSRIKYVWQENAGVANARNKGISYAETKYVCCLDADDAIKPEFIRACVDVLETDRSLGIAYTGLWYIKPDGSEGISPWPGEYNFDRQLQRQNQVPTCCVFKKEAWARVGGYKQRYAPDGAGSEDAEFFTRLGAYGFGAKKATDAGLFLYSWMSGRVSGNKQYREVDWLELHPWVKDKQHPFASVATPEALSHPVRQYDQPTISVIIPVGPAHAKDFALALDSLESQTFRKWEAVVVWDNSDEIDPAIIKAYPYMRIFKTEYGKGAGHARNVGAKNARAPFLLFLDADDWLYPTCMEKMLSAYKANEAIAYSDYIGKAYMSENDAMMLGERLLYYDRKVGQAVIRYSSADYDYNKAIEQPMSAKIYIWNLVTSLVPKAWHNEIGGFDEKMPSWEDWDYWLRMARYGKCFIRIPEPLVVYRFYTGTRRDTGVQFSNELLYYLTEKYKGIPLMACGCKNNKQQPPPPTVVTQQTERYAMTNVRDDEVVLVEYMSPNRGSHKVIGVSTKRFLGYRSGGDIFYIPVADYRAATNMYRLIPETPPAPKEVVDTPPPTPLVLPQEPEIEQPVQEVQAVEQLPMLDLQTVPGVTPAIAKQLDEEGVRTLRDIVDLGFNALIHMKGIGPARASAIMEYARSQVEPS